MGHQHQSPGQSEASPWVPWKTRFVALKGQNRMAHFSAEMEFQLSFIAA